MKEQDTQKLLCFWQIRARVPALLQLSPVKKVRLQLASDDLLYFAFQPSTGLQKPKDYPTYVSCWQTSGVGFKATQSESTISQPLFPLQVHPLGVSGGSSWSELSSSCAPWWQFALGHEARLGCVEGAKGLRRCREVALSCSLWPKYSMNASGVRLCSWAKECPQWLPSGTLLSVQFRVLAGLPSGQGLGP